MSFPALDHCTNLFSFSEQSQHASRSVVRAAHGQGLGLSQDLFEAEKIITAVAAEQSLEEDDQQFADKIKDGPLASPATEFQAVQTSARLAAPAIVV